MSFYKKYVGEGWSKVLQPFFDSEEYKIIGEALIPIQKKVTPELSQIYRCFLECPWERLHTVILNLGPYSQLTKDGIRVADGLAFSARNSELAPVQLETVHQVLDETVYAGHYTPVPHWNYEQSLAGYDLKSWANQGILLLNCSLTTLIGKEHEHLDLWHPFIEYILSMINSQKDSIGFIIIGSPKIDINKLLTNNTFYKCTCEPIMAAKYMNRQWFHRDCFKSIHDFHRKTNNIEIKW